ncbi:MAG: hypothetical protein BWY31_04088 [Lentisphaerae bacterium ADurb.Bin242]|nr:MAG: hypothetical protein BWY31_04088 [Lentisphaerae bacterium ADurb.Bin242]
MKRRFFTLVELLVVVAIIAILAGMLLPALNKARQTAQSVSCLGKLKTLGLTTTLYVDTYNGWMLNAINYYNYGTQLNWYALFGRSDWSGLLPFGSSTYYSTPARDMKAYYCPVGKTPTSQAHLYGMAYVNADNTYYSQVVEPGAYLYIKKIGTAYNADPFFGHVFHFYSGQNKNIGGFPLFADSVTTGGVQNFYFHKGGGGSALCVSPRHNNKVNIAFADGHSEGIHYSRLGKPPHKIRYYGYDNGEIGLTARTMD